MSRLYYGAMMIRYDPALYNKYNELALRYESRMGTKERMQLRAINLGGVKTIEKLKEILELWPDDRETLQMLVLRTHYNWMQKECIEYSRIGLTLYPEDQVFGGSIYITSLNNLGLSQEAMKASREFIRKYPDDSAAWRSLAETFVVMGQPDSAEAICRIILEKYPEGSQNAEARRMIARCAYLAGDLDESISRYDRLLSDANLDESTRQEILSNYTHIIDLTYVYREAGRYYDALRTLNEARPYFGNRPDRWELQMGYLLVDIGRNKNALKLAEEMLASDNMPMQRYARRFMGKAQVNNGDIQGAQETVSILDGLGIVRGPIYKYHSFFTQAYIALARNDASVSLKHLDDAAQIVGFSYCMFGIELKTLQAEANRLAGDLEAAASIHEELLRIHGGHALSHFELGKLYEAMRRTDEAKLHYNRFLEMWNNADDGLPQPALARERLTALKGV